MSEGIVEEIEKFILDLADQEHVSPQTIASAQTALRAYRDDDSAGFVWTGLTKQIWCARVELLLGEPWRVNQRPTSYCMPAACLYVLFKTVPEVMAGFCIGLAREGKGTIGDLSIEMSSALRACDLKVHAETALQPIDPIDFILLLAMQNEMSVTAIDSPEDLAARPGSAVSNVTDLLSATDLYTVTRKNNPKVADFGAADPKAEAVLFANISLFSSAASPEHAAVLVAPLEVNAGQVKLRFWSWGMFEGNQTLPVEGGAYINQLSQASFEAKIGSVVFVKLKT